MNYLAHAYLSFDNPEWLLGNLISDFVKGKKRFDYPAGVQEGIMLHRAIDAFTDDHPATREAREIFRPAYRLYSGAFMDIVYDHFLANDPLRFPNEASLEAFAQNTYKTLSVHHPLFPPVFNEVFARMRQYNWLFHYRFPMGMANSFKGLVMRSAFLTDWETAFTLFEMNYKPLEEAYASFFPDLFAFCQDYISGLPERTER